MFRPKESYDMPDPFAPRLRRPTAADYTHMDHMVAKFTFKHQQNPKEPISRSQAARALHPLAREAGVLGTIYEQTTKVWKRNCKYDLEYCLRVAIHGSNPAIDHFLKLMRDKLPAYHVLVQPGFKLRTVAAFGGKPGDIMKPPGSKRYSKFGRKSAI